jgi:hypothetical protein
MFSLSPLMTPHVSFECWCVPILDKPIYSVLFQNLLFLPSKKIHNIWGLKRLTSLSGLIFFEQYASSNFRLIGSEVDCFKKLVYETIIIHCDF